MGRKWLWIGIAAVLVVWAGVTAYLWSRPRFDYEPIGDELFDRTALWVLEQHAAMPGEPGRFQEWLYNNTGFYEFPEYIVDFSEPFSWQAAFGDDPRYRQLIWQLAPLHELLDADEVKGYVATPEWLRRETLAREGGNLGDYVLLRWHTGLIPDVPPNQELAEGEKEIALLRELADAAIALDADNSYFYYVKADLEFGLGEIDEAWDLVKAGNAAPQNYIPLAFPESLLMEAAGKFATSDSKRVAAIMWLVFVCDHDQYFLKIKERYKELECALLLGYPLAIADDYITRARRMAEMENQSLFGHLCALLYAWILVDCMIEQGVLDLSPAQYDEAQLIIEFTHSAAEELQDYSAHISIYSSVPGYSSPVFPLEGISVQPQVWDLIVAEMDRAEELRAEADILDPSPFSIWARGELIGLDTSRVVVEEGEAAGDS